MITLDQVLSGRNILRAIKQVVSNKGAPGIDGMTVDQYEAHHRRHWRSIAEHIRAGSYIPAPVRRVDIPKPNGGTRMLGIPTVQDRVIQQAIAQILVEAYDPHFSNSSYGFRPGRSALEAIEQAYRYIKEGKNWVVEMDLEKFFDTVNHDRLMARLAKRIKDKALLKLIGRYLRNGIMQNGLVSPREEGTPQGSNLSPILSLIVLDELDKHLEGRGLSFCRYADDCNLFVSSRQAGERVLEKTIKFIEGTLKLRVNRSKSGLFRPSKSKFLGYTFVGTSGAPRVAKASFARLMYKLRPILRRGRGRSLLGNDQGLDDDPARMENLLRAGRSERGLRTYRHSHSPASAQTGLAGMEASHHSGTRAETQRTAKRTSMEIVRQWTRPVVERQRPSHAQSTSQQRLSTNGALQSLVKGLTTESTT